MRSLTPSRPVWLKRAALLIPLISVTACGSEPLTPAEHGRAGDGTLADGLEFVRDAYDVPALAAVLVYQGRVVEMAAVGLRADDGSESVTIDDLWHIGSITKSMTSTVVARFVEQGVLSWGTTVSQALPELIDDIRPEYADVTFTDLLSHTSGLPNVIHEVPIWSTLEADVGPGTTEERRQWSAQLLTLEPENPRGSHLYSNAGYVVAGTMLEALTGLAWETLIQQELFQPLGMSTAGFGAPGQPGVRNQPWGHVPDGDGWRALSPGPGADNPAAIGPAGTVHASLADMAAYIVAHVAGARGQGGILRPETFEVLRTPPPASWYGLGWGIVEQPWTGGRALHHTGSNNRWYARIWLIPNKDYGFFTVTNAPGDPGSESTNAAAILLIDRFEAAFEN